MTNLTLEPPSHQAFLSVQQESTFGSFFLHCANHNFTVASWTTFFFFFFLFISFDKCKCCSCVS